MDRRLSAYDRPGPMRDAGALIFWLAAGAGALATPGLERELGLTVAFPPPSLTMLLSGIQPLHLIERTL
jgi:hypothetical protein